ncbi:MAG: hypothetical protein ABJH04_07770 [Cyclobacteriaceae bacterium]
MKTYSYPPAKLEQGQTFSITHSDGFVANEKVSKILNDGFNNYYVCESAATYSDFDLTMGMDKSSNSVE